MGRASNEGVPVVVSVSHTNKVVASRMEVANMFRPTTQTPPLLTSDMATTASGTIDEPLPRDTQPSIEPPPPVIDVAVPSLRESQPALEVLAITPPVAPMPTASAVHAAAEAAPTAIDPASAEPNHVASTSLGVAPLEPATVVRAPYVIDTPVERWSPLPRASTPSVFAEHGRPEMVRTASAPVIPTDGVAMEPSADDPAHPHRSRTAMIALDPGSGLPRPWPWQTVLAGLARTIRSVQWWLARRRTDRLRRES
jgi:hypothetical protein